MFKECCQLLQKKGVHAAFLLDNARYHLVKMSTGDFEWPKGRNQSNALKKNLSDYLETFKIKFEPKALKPVLQKLVREHFSENSTMAVENVAQQYGHRVLMLPPYMFQLQPIEEAFGTIKNTVAWHRDSEPNPNKRFTMKTTKILLEKGVAKVTEELCAKYFKHTEEYIQKH